MIKMTPLVGTPAPWLTNVHRTEVAETISRLCMGNPERRLAIGSPAESKAHSENELTRMGMVGLYETEAGKPVPAVAMKQILTNAAWRFFVRHAFRWASEHMDQWEQIKFKAADGNTVYLTMSYKSDWPESFIPVDAEGNVVVSTDWRD